MKLNKIKISNLLAIKSAEIETDKPIVFISGNNEAGKSSLADTVSMALTGDLCRVPLKKDAHWLVNGDEEGMVEVHVGEHYFYHRITKKCTVKGVGIDPVPALPYVLDTAKFARATADERRKLLFDISGCKVSAEEVMRRMVARDINEKTASYITPLLRSGFPAAMDAAKEKAKEHKVLWKGLTKEVYGEKKAEGWKVKAEGNLEEIQNAVMEKEKELVAVDSDFEQASQRFGAMQAAKNKSDAKAKEIAFLQEQAGKIDRIKQKLEFDRQQVTDWTAMIERVKLATSGIGEGDARCACPECGAELIFVAKDKKLIPHGDLKGDEDAAANLPQYQRSLETCMNAVRNGERDLALAEEAKTKLAMIDADSPEVDDAAIIAMTAKIDELKAQKRTLSETINNLLAEELALREADQTTAKAYEHHTQVVEWEKIAAALAPDGIPGEMLQDAIKPVNERLKQQAEQADWEAPLIDSDMNISRSGMPYGLLSKSAQWRVNCLIAEAISHISGIKFMVIDEMDILEPSGNSRGYFFSWLSELAIRNEVETVLVMGTLAKEKAGVVASVFQNIAAYWMQDSVLEKVVVKDKAKEVAA